jgi:hypothetical protein
VTTSKLPEPVRPIIADDAEPDVPWGQGGLDDYGWQCVQADDELATELHRLDERRRP